MKTKKWLHSLVKCMFLITVLPGISGCHRTSQEEIYEEAQSALRSLVLSLQEVRGHEAMQAYTSRVTRHFEKLVSLMIAAREASIEETSAHESLSMYSNENWGEKLRIELERIFEIEGGKEWIERCQYPALVQLDRFERQFNASRSKLLSVGD